jgi:hypothetical protein
LKEILLKIKTPNIRDEIISLLKKFIIVLKKDILNESFYIIYVSIYKLVADPSDFSNFLILTNELISILKVKKFHVQISNLERFFIIDARNISIHSPERI